MEQENRNLLKGLGVAVALAFVAALVGKVAGFSVLNDGADAAITAQLVAEAQKRHAAALPCDITIAQFGPGERWKSHHHTYECARTARSLPAGVLTSPVAQR